MKKINVKINKLNENATIPTYGSEYAAGADLYACIDKPIVIKIDITILNVSDGVVNEKAQTGSFFW